MPPNLSHRSTDDLKQEILKLGEGNDRAPLSQKVKFYQSTLAPLFAELSQRNPFSSAEEQVAIVLGVWLPVWSTIPFIEILPGRVREQSYQIFQDNGYYANIARYAPGQRNSFLQAFSAFLLAYDFMLLQKFVVQNGQWYIQNVGIEQAFRWRGSLLTSERAESWLSKVVRSKLSKGDAPKAPDLSSLDKSTAKKVGTSFLATPQLEHLYIDRDFRLVKSQRNQQRPSYTIAIRQQ
ncbi:hypothetical protein [Myxacorys almedinensis]|uniref:hypothetical protein n=1 Tax=Myxacorys almedinensis TaxID=2651157 RepID=UPI003083A050